MKVGDKVTITMEVTETLGDMVFLVCDGTKIRSRASGWMHVDDCRTVEPESVVKQPLTPASLYRVKDRVIIIKPDSLLYSHRGTITRIDFRNPEVPYYVSSDSGSQFGWFGEKDIEHTVPELRGVRVTLKVGDKVELKCNNHFDGAKGLITQRHADGDWFWFEALDPRHKSISGWKAETWESEECGTCRLVKID
jgi:hypothetical protein